MESPVSLGGNTYEVPFHYGKEETARHYAVHPVGSTDTTNLYLKDYDRESPVSLGGNTYKCRFTTAKRRQRATMPPIPSAVQAPSSSISKIMIVT